MSLTEGEEIPSPVTTPTCHQRGDNLQAHFTDPAGERLISAALRKGSGETGVWSYASGTRGYWALCTADW